MALVLADRVRDTTTTTGTGTVTLSGTAPTGYQTFGAAVGNGNTTYYTINAGSQWEVGVGTYSSTGPTLSRDTVYASSNAGALVNFSVGTKDVFVTYPAGRAIANGYGVLPVANGGTGATDAATARSNLGAGTVTSVAASGGTTGLTFSGSPIGSSGTLTLGGTLAVASGGTGATSLTSGYLVKGNGTSAVSASVIYDSGTNVGIGTNSPSYILDVGSFAAGTAQTVRVAAAANVNTQLKLMEAADTFGFTIRNTAASGLSILRHSADATGVTALFIGRDTGNVGIGTSSPDRRLVLSGSSVSMGLYATNGGNLSLDAPISGLAQIDVGGANAFRINTNSAERMRVTSGGDVGIGTSSPGAKLDVNGIALARQDASTGTTPVIAKNDSTANNTTKYTSIGFQGVDTVGTGKNVGLIVANPDDANWVGSYLTFQTRSSDALSERMRIGANGNVGIGVSNTTDFRLLVQSSTSDSTTYPLVVRNSSTSNIFYARSDGAIFAPPTYNIAVGATNRDLYIDNGGVIGYVSSIRASKTNIADITDVTWLDRLQPRTFNFRKRDAAGNYTDEAEAPLEYGLIAEEVEQVNPELTFYDETENGRELRGVSYSKLVVPLLAKIQQLEARVAHLEGNNP